MTADRPTGPFRVVFDQLRHVVFKKSCHGGSHSA